MVIEFSAFKDLPEENQKQILQDLRKELGIAGLVSAWGISTSKLYNLIHELELPVSSRGRKGKRAAAGRREPMVLPPPADEEVIAPPAAIIVPGEASKFSFSLMAEGSGDSLLAKLQPLLNSIAASGLKIKISVIAEEI